MSLAKIIRDKVWVSCLFRGFVGWAGSLVMRSSLEALDCLDDGLGVDLESLEQLLWLTADWHGLDVQLSVVELLVRRIQQQSAGDSLSNTTWKING